MNRSILLTGGILVSLLVLGGAGCITLGNKNNTAASGPMGVFVSVDKGKEWQPASVMPTAEGPRNMNNVSVFSLVGDPLDASSIYWLSRESGLLFTYNDGRTWSRPERGPFTGGMITAFAVHPDNKCILYGSGGALVHRSDDCGRTWREVYRESRPGVQVVSLAFNPFSPYQIFFAESNGDLMQNDGTVEEWSVVNRFEKNLVRITFDPFEEGKIYLATRQDGLQLTEDFGATWEDLSESMKEYSGATTYRRMVVHPKKENVVYWISTYGILVSDDSGHSWTPLDLLTAPGSAQIYAFAFNPNNDKEMYYTATIGGRSTFYKSENGGATWVTGKLPSGQLPTQLYVHPAKGEMVYLGFSPAPKQ